MSAYFPQRRFETFQSARDFLEHVKTLQRIPQRKSSKAPKLPRLSGAPKKGELVFLLKSGRASYPINFTLRAEGRKKFKVISGPCVAAAAAALLQTQENLTAFLERKKFLIQSA